MHELSLCMRISGIVDRAAEGRPVAVVHLQVGQLRQVVPETLRSCWRLVAEGTPLAGSVLDVESVPVTATCRDCGHVTTIEQALILVCAGCDGTALDITTGEELLLTALDLAEV